MLILHFSVAYIIVNRKVMTLISSRGLIGILGGWGNVCLYVYELQIAVCVSNSASHLP